MLVLLMHNRSAGDEDHDASELAREIERHGHRVVGHATRRKELSRALRHPPDLVAVAGGDGTVGTAARVLHGTDIPFTILPLGTANNLARTLGLDGPLPETIAGWQGAEVRPFDAARAEFRSRSRPFIEGFGFGAVVRTMRRAQRAPEPAERDQTLGRDIELLRRTLSDAPLRPYRLSADGEDLSGAYLLVEVLNIPRVGPGFPLCAQASPSDGKLDLVLAGEAERRLLLDAVDRLAAGHEVEPVLPSRRCQRVVISRGRRRYHHDGELGQDRARRCEIAVEPRALRVLVRRDG
jgi:diacylglycerol kinase family enzyme